MEPILCLFRVQTTVSSWLEWVLRLPVEVKDVVKIEGVYGSFSTTVLLSMPVLLWNRLLLSPPLSLRSVSSLIEHETRTPRSCDNPKARYQQSLRPCL